MRPWSTILSGGLILALGFCCTSFRLACTALPRRRGGYRILGCPLSDVPGRALIGLEGVTCTPLSSHLWPQSR